VPWFGRISATLITLAAMLLSLMLLTQNSLIDIVNRTSKNFLELRKSFVPAVTETIQDFKEKQEQRKSERTKENTKKERRDYVPPNIVVKEDANDDGAPRK
jgi:hypothetical protein